MKKYLFILIAVFLIFSIYVSAYYISLQNKQEQQELSITEAFNFSGARMIVNKLNFFVRADDNYKTLDSLTKVCNEVYNAVGINNQSVISSSTDNFIRTDFNGITSDGLKITAMASIVEDKKGGVDKYITVEVVGADDGSAILLRDNIEQVFKKHQLKSVVNSCITGTYEGNLSDTQLENICKKILNESGAKKIDSARYTNRISVSAFSPMIKDTLNIGGKDVNLSLSIRYNKQEDKTYLWVATPVDNEDY